VTTSRRAALLAVALVAVLVLALGADRWASESPDGFERVAIDNALLVEEPEATEPTDDGLDVGTVARTAAGVVAVALTMLALPRIVRRAAEER